jgi:DNA mismatch repair protein MutS2
MGVPGSSYAFEIAGKYGFPDPLLAEARSFLGRERGRLDGLIASLEEKLKGAEALHREAAAREARAAELERYVETRLETIDDEASALRGEKLAEAEALFREAQVLKERVLKEIRESGGASETVRRLHEELRAGAAAVKALVAAKKPDRRSGALRVGDWVVWPGHGGAGRVAEAPDRNGRVLVEWNDVRVRIETRALEPTAPPSGPRRRAGFVNVDYEKPSGNEVDLRGMTADEALSALERYLGDAAAAGFTSARIIHGKGTGVLRREVRKFLSDHPLVKSARSGEWNEGDTGVTVVEFQ